MKTKHIIKAILAASAIASGSSQAVVISGLDYDTNITFTGISSSVFTTPQTFALTGAHAGWSVTVAAQFSNPDYLSAPTLPITVATTNVTGAPWQNPTFPGAQGVYFSQLPNTYLGNNLTVSFSFEFTRTSGMNTIQLAAYSAESSDNEIDTLTHSGGVFSNFTTGNLASATGEGTATAVFSSTPDPSGIGQYITTTTVNDGDVITWNYDYVLGSGEGKNMIAFSAASVPEPSSLLLGSIAMAAFGIRRRR